MKVCGGDPLSASRQPLCRCGLRPFTRKIETFSACVPTGTPANNHAAARSACYQPRLASASPHVAEVGRPTLLGLRCTRRIKRQGGTLCRCRSRRLRPPSPYGRPLDRQVVTQPFEQRRDKHVNRRAPVIHPTDTRGSAPARTMPFLCFSVVRLLAARGGGSLRGAGAYLSLLLRRPPLTALGVLGEVGHATSPSGARGSAPEGETETLNIKYSGSPWEQVLYCPSVNRGTSGEGSPP